MGARRVLYFLTVIHIRIPINQVVEGGGFEPPKLARQIYSLIPLATREPHLERAQHSAYMAIPCQHIVAKRINNAIT